MSGIKGRSGRRKRSIEDKRKETIDKGWDILRIALHDETTPLNERIDIAKMLVGRDIARDQKLKVGTEATIIYNSGTPRPQLVHAPHTAEAICIDTISSKSTDDNTTQGTHNKPDAKEPDAGTVPN